MLGQDARGRAARAREGLRRLVPPFLPVLALELLFAALATSVGEYPGANPFVWLWWLEKWAVSFAVFGSCLVLLHKTVRPAGLAAWAGGAFAVLYLASIAIDTALFRFTNSLFTRDYLSMLDTEFVLAWVVNPPALLFLAFTAALMALAAILAARQHLTLAAVPARYPLGALALVAVLGLLKIMRVSVPFLAFNYLYRPHLDDTDNRQRYLDQRLAYVTGNHLAHLLAETIVSDLLVERLSRVNRIRTSDLPEYREAIEHYRLALGPRASQPVPVKPFRRIVQISVESLSLDFLSPHNPSLPFTNVRFYADEAVRQATLTRYMTTAAPTTPALLVTFTSHPNREWLTGVGGGTSLPAVLKSHGYRTIHLQGTPKRFANDEQRWRRLGFEQIVGQEEFEAQPRLKKYVQGWGAFDRVVFDRALEILADPGASGSDGDKVYLHVSTVDTHPPLGRIKGYQDIDYPPLPPGLAEFPGLAPGLKKYLESVFYHSCEMERFFAELRRRGLWTEETLVVVTADHACLVPELPKTFPGYPAGLLTRIPLIFLSPQPLPPLADRDGLACQLDLAPSILHLLSIPVPAGWWGESLFDPRRKGVAISNDGGRLTIRAPGLAEEVRIDDPRTAAERQLVRLLKSELRD